MPHQRRCWNGHAGVDVVTDPRAPRLAKTVEPEEIQSKTGLAYLHSSHCLGSGKCHVVGILATLICLQLVEQACWDETHLFNLPCR